MAITEFQRKICRLIADSRKKTGVSYIAGGVSLNHLTESTRISNDIDIFNDSRDALDVGWDMDRKLLEQHGYNLEIIRERPSFIEAMISDECDKVIMQWTCDSAFRFFPLVEHEDFGLTLHPLDLATNKALALVGRLEVRDWIDILTSHKKIQHFALIAWAACGKDPGFSPEMILAEARRSAHYTQGEIDALLFSDAPPSAAELSLKWRRILDSAEKIISFLPPEHAGKCILDEYGNLFKGDLPELITAIENETIIFHEGTLHGAYPVIKDQ